MQSKYNNTVLQKDHYYPVTTVPFVLILVAVIEFITICE